MFCRRNQWAGAKFPRQLFHQSRSKRGRVLMHSKVGMTQRVPFPTHPPDSQMILASFRQRSNAFEGHEADSESETEDESDADDSAQSKPAGWLYVGSHNFTPSAWGTLSGSAFNPVLNVGKLSTW